ncbi:TorF family putative porin [Pseudoalteromonas sp. MMG013]|uniref:TorF family putative porin n=1 Tax=unclassified Pseudoalteromonas TaxID=194690 RepID=UPI001B369DDC|nr:MULTISPECIES: TorF family putative porin [unclassified Pseudoalteromonas]MBQ4846610.1 TorF family putative porin [Pseudoalteromonas sp. MMG005]MBQ4862716.1 TorF family putative porin [Pseudoalteromonas sp. MMG013]
MNKLLPLIVASSFMSVTSFHSMAEVTANVAASSNYFWRGITQTKDGSAVSGGIDYSDDSGFYAGTWVSNVDFGNKTSYELDLYAGFSGEQGQFGYDVGYIHYAYPDAEGSIDFGELYGALSWQWLSFKASYLTHAQEDQSTEEEMLYLELGASFTILNDTDLSFHIGRSSGDTVLEWTSEDDAYMDYGVSVAKNGFTLGVVKTDLDADDDVKAYVSYGLDFEL